MRVTTLAILAIGLAGCQQQPQGKNKPVTEGEATRIAEQTEANFTKGNPDDVMRQYADNAVLFDATHPALSTDRKVQAGWAKEFVSMKPSDYHVPDRHIQVVGPDAFVSSGTEMFTVEAGTARPTISARFSDVYQRQRDGSWKIVNEHVSLPPASAGQK